MATRGCQRIAARRASSTQSIATPVSTSEAYPSWRMPMNTQRTQQAGGGVAVFPLKDQRISLQDHIAHHAAGHARSSPMISAVLCGILCCSATWCRSR